MRVPVSGASAPARRAARARPPRRAVRESRRRCRARAAARALRRRRAGCVGGLAREEALARRRRRARAPRRRARRHGRQSAVSCSQLPGEPRARERPVALHGRGGDVHGLGRFLDRQAAEEAQLDDPRLAGVERGEPLERRVERDHVERRGRRAAAGSPSSKVTRGAPPPRFSASRARARSIRICRIACAAIAQKCARFCQRSGRSFCSLRYASWTSAVGWSVWPGRSPRR